MSYRIKLGDSFKREFKRLRKRYHSLDSDFDHLLTELETSPFTGAPLGNGVRKVRMAIASKGKGKSHGARVITYTIQVDEATGTIHLLYLYDKAERSTITPAEISALMDEIQE